MKLSKFILAFTLLTSTEAFSQTYGSYRKNKNVRLTYMGQYKEASAEPVLYAHPTEGNTLLTFGYSWEKADQDISTLFGYNDSRYSIKSQTEVSQARLGAEFGVYGGFFGGVSMAHTDANQSAESGDIRVSSSDKGISDPKLSAGHQFRWNSWKFISSVAYQVKAQDRIIDGKDSGNGKEGASYFQPEFVAAYNFDNVIAGIDVMAFIRGEKTTKYSLSSSTTKRTGGNTYVGTGFLEFPGKIQPGVSLSLNHSDTSIVEHSDGRRIESGSSNTGIVVVYSQIKIAKNFKLIPRAGYATLLSYDTSSTGDKLEKAEFQNVGLDARLGF